MDPPETAPESLVQARERSRRLSERIANEARAAGVLPFDRFVELALYDPSDGYYVQAGRSLGRSGDFYTAAHVTPLFGRTIARRVLVEQERLGRRDSFVLVEAGAGDGTLARDLREALTAEEGRSPIPRHVLVELPGPRRERLAHRVGGVIASDPPPEFVSSVAELGPFRGVVVANELLDAMPFRRLIRRGTEWRELGVAAEDGSLVWAESPHVRPLPPPELPEAPEGTILEVSEAAEGWIREISDHLVDGVLILLDYGRPEAELVRAFSRGTLATARGHRAGLDPLESPGTTDLSAFVNLTRIRAAAERAGLSILSDRPQAEALGAWGFEELQRAALRATNDAEAKVRLALAVKNLLFGFEGFRALELVPARR